MSPYTLLAAGLAVLGAAGAGYLKGHHDGSSSVQEKWTAEQLATSEHARQIEDANARKAIRTLDLYAQKLQAEQGATVAAVRDAQRVRGEAQRIAALPTSPACQPERDTVTRLAELLAEGAGLAEEGRRYLGECRGARQAVSEGGRLDR